MGEAKAKRARLTALLGETRGDQFEEFLADLQTLTPRTPAEHDRVYFLRLFATAVVEGLNARTKDSDSAARCVEVFEEMTYVVGTQIGLNLMQLVRDDIPDKADAGVFLANRVSVYFAQGMAVALGQLGGSLAKAGVDND